MSSVVGHALAGCAAYQVVRYAGRESYFGLDPIPRLLSVFALISFVAVAPDLDVIIMFFTKPGMSISHRAQSHSVFVIMVMCLVLTGIFHLFSNPDNYFKMLEFSGSLFLGVFAAAISHPVLDILMGASAPQVALLWPLSDKGLLSPYSFVPVASYATAPRGLAMIFASLYTWFGFAVEALIFVPLVLVLSTSCHPSRRIFLLSVSGSALLFTFLYFNHFIMFR